MSICIRAWMITQRPAGELLDSRSDVVHPSIIELFSTTERVFEFSQPSEGTSCVPHRLLEATASRHAVKLVLLDQTLPVQSCQRLDLKNEPLPRSSPVQLDRSQLNGRDRDRPAWSNLLECPNLKRQREGKTRMSIGEARNADDRPKVSLLSGRRLCPCRIDVMSTWQDPRTTVQAWMNGRMNDWKLQRKSC